MKRNTRPTSPRGRLAAWVLLLACILPAAPAHADEAAEHYVMDLVARAVAILDNREEDEETRREAFRALLLANVDRRLPIFLLGQYARQLKLDDAQKHAYLRLLREFMARIYFVRLQEYADDSIKVNGSRDRSNGREVVVFGTIHSPERNRPLSLNWWLSRHEGGAEGADGAETAEFRIFDVQVAGIWLAQEVRSGFVSVIRNNQGSFDALLAHLRHQIDAQAEAQTSEAQ